MKTLMFDAGAGLLFLAVLLVTRNMAAAVVVAGIASVALIGWLLLKRRPVAPLQWLWLGLIVGLGGMSLVTRDPRFVMLKPTVIQACLGAAMLRPGWLNRYMSPRRLALIPPNALVVAGYAYAVMLFVLAAANLTVALIAGPVAWAAYSAVAPAAAFGLMGAGVYLALRRLVRARAAAPQTAAIAAS